MLRLIAAPLALVATTATADVTVRFVESAPSDRFEIANSGACTLGTFRLTVDLTESAGKLIFDTADSGPGVEVFQPFAASTDAVVLEGAISDGATELTISVGGLKPGEVTAFTIDVDDTLPESQLGQIRVAGSELTGASVALSGLAAAPAIGTFDQRGLAVASLAACTS